MIQYWVWKTMSWEWVTHATSRQLIQVAHLQPGPRVPFHLPHWQPLLRRCHPGMVERVLDPFTRVWLGMLQLVGLRNRDDSCAHKLQRGCSPAKAGRSEGSRGEGCQGRWAKTWVQLTYSLEQLLTWEEFHTSTTKEMAARQVLGTK